MFRTYNLIGIPFIRGSATSWRDEELIKALFRGTLALVLAVILASPALAQRDRDNRESGPLQSPRPYGDRGSRIIGDPPIHYPTRPPIGANPVQYWKDRIIATPRHGGATVIIVNGSPCYTPWYYGYSFPGQYSDSYLYGSVNLGGFNLGYSQRQSGYSFGAVPPVYAQVPQPVDTRTQQYLDEIRVRDAQRAGTNRRPATDDDASYYLHQKPKPKTMVEKDPSLSQAVANIERAFRTGDIKTLEPHVVRNENLILASKGQTRKPLSGDTYLELTRDALKNMKTLKFELASAEPASNGAVLVYGTHVLQAEDGKGLSFSVGFVLKKRGDQWFISEVSADPTK